MANITIKYLLLLCLSAVVLFSSCGIFTNEYSYNRSRGGEPERREDDRRVSEEEEEEEDLLFEEEDEVVANDKEEETVLPPLEEEEKEELPDELRRRRDIAEYAHKYLGTKYKYGGKTPKGFDCSGFTRYVMKEFDVELPGVSAYQAKEGKKVREKDARPGDLVFYRRSAVGKVFHVSLVVDNDKEEGLTVIHSVSRGVVVENISQSTYWAPKIAFVRDVLDN